MSIGKSSNSEQKSDKSGSNEDWTNTELGIRMVRSRSGKNLIITLLQHAILWYYTIFLRYFMQN